MTATGRALTRCRAMTAVLGLLFAALAAGAARTDDIIGEQKVAVILARYKDSAAPKVTIQAWVEKLNDEVNDYYREATRGKTRFKFVGFNTIAPSFEDGTLRLRYTYDETAPGGSASTLPNDGSFSVFNDPEVMQREARDVITPWARTLGNEGYQRILIVVNGEKRGRARRRMEFETTGDLTFTRKTHHFDVAVIPEPADGKIKSEKIGTICHEMGHLLGLPDLYREPARDANTHREFTEFWCLMAYDNHQNFSAFSRQMMGWLDPSHVERINPPPPGTTLERTITLKPSLRAVNNSDRELIYLPLDILAGSDPLNTGNFVTFRGYMVEARSRQGLDETRSVEAADASKFQESQGGKPRSFLGQPAGYREGVVITYVRSGAPDGTRPLFQPLSLRPQAESGDPTRENQRQLAAAAFLPGKAADTFTDPENHLSVKVLERLADGGYRVRVRWAPPPVPDIVATDAWLDNPSNGYDTFWTERRPDGVPALFGDPVFNTVRIRWSRGVRDLPGAPTATTEIGTVPHRLRFRVQNWGGAPAANVAGEVYLFNPQLVRLEDVADPERRARLDGIRRVGVAQFGTVPPGGTADCAPITVEPMGPFVAALLLSPCRSPEGRAETNRINNDRLEPFLAVQVAPGSPYRPVDVQIPVTNLDAATHLMFPGFSSLPDGWTSRITSRADAARGYAALAKGGSETFRILVQPDDPAREKPGQLKVLETEAYMDYGDSFVPIGKLPLSVVLSYQSVLRLQVDKSEPGKAVVSGTLTYVDGKAEKPIAAAPVSFVLSGDDGSERVITPGTPGHAAVTDAAGRFVQTVVTGRAVQYAIAAQYGGSIRYSAARSPLQRIGQKR